MVPHPRGGEWEHRQRQQWRWQGEPGGQGGKFWMAIGSEEVQSAFFKATDGYGASHTVSIFKNLLAKAQLG